MKLAAPFACLAFLAASLPARSVEMPIDVVAGAAGAFIHLDATGRRGLALSGGTAALVWEDNRSGAPACHVGIKPAEASAFSEYAMGRGECFEPAVAALDAGRFLLIWEDETGVNSALADIHGVGPAVRLAEAGGQGSVVFHPRLGAFAAWSAPEGRWRRIRLAPLAIESGTLKPSPGMPVDAEAPVDDQSFPALAATEQGLALAWEDRRHGHTVIYGGGSLDGATWSVPKRISGNPTGKAQGNLGRGTGAMRPSLAAFGARLAATWLDKRDFLSGYDVYAALPGDTRNTKAQDSFGDAIAQWHPAVASQDGKHLVVAWDDDRDGTSDIWLSHLLPTGGFSENVAPAPASGPKVQTDPVLTLTAAGELHLAWVERDGQGHSSIRYSLGKPEPGH